MPGFAPVWSLTVRRPPVTPSPAASASWWSIGETRHSAVTDDYMLGKLLNKKAMSMDFEKSDATDRHNTLFVSVDLARDVDF